MTFPFEPVKTDEWLQRRRSFLINLHSGIGLNLRVNGNTAVGAGDVVQVDLKSPLQNPEINKDDFYSGNFLVTKIKHVFSVSNAKHEMSLTVMKDSIERKLPTGANDEPASGVQRNPDVLGEKDKRTPAEKRVSQIGGGSSGTTSKSEKQMIERFENDPEFQKAWERLKAKRPQVDKSDFYHTIYGESRGNISAINKSSGTAGLFQFTRNTAKHFGTTPEEVIEMSAAQQVDVYSKYLYMYKGGNLSVYGAAPSYAHKSDDTIIYKVGSKAWNINKSYRPADNGPITVGSLKNFFNSKKYG